MWQLKMKLNFFYNFQILGNKLKMGLVMSGELFSLEGQEHMMGALEMEELAVDTEKLNLNLNVSSTTIDHFNRLRQRLYPNKSTFFFSLSISSKISY